MGVLHDVVDGLGPRGVAGQAAALPQMGEVLTTGEQLVDIGLVPGIEHDGVPRRAEGPVQCDRQLDNPEVGAEVAAGARH